MNPKQVRFKIDYDKTYTNTFATGLEISAVTPERLALTFYYEQANRPLEFTSKLDEKGQILPVPQNTETIEINRLVKADISVDRTTAKIMLDLLQAHLDK